MKLNEVLVEILQFSEVKIDRLLKLSEIVPVAIQFGSCFTVVVSSSAESTDEDGDAE